MSRIGKIPIRVPKEAKVSVESGTVHLEGPKGKLALKVPMGLSVDYKDDQLTVQRKNHTKQNLANHGTTRALLANMMAGVIEGHKKELQIEGIGFRAHLQGKSILFNLGYSHPVKFEIPEYVKVVIPNQTFISIEGPDKQRVGEVAASIRSIKPVEPYKGKGISYVGEVVRRKQGKSVTK